MAYTKKFDHRDRNFLNNQKSNLRECTSNQNAFNRIKMPFVSSKYKGVCWHSRDKKWAAQIIFQYKQIHLGNFICEIQAALAYDKKAKELFGEFAKLNFYIT